MPQPHLPPEIADHIIDLLHDQPDTLRNCCLASTSFIYRARKYLFEDIGFASSPEDFPKLEAWKKTFLNHKTSPAHHTRSLSVGCTEIVTDEDAKEGGWIEPFSEVVRLELWDGSWDGPVVNHSFHPFHVLSKVKHLRLVFTTIPPLDLLKFICSFPLLEDLDVAGRDPDAIGTDGGGTIVWPPNFQFPPLTGTLVVRRSRLDRIAHLLLALPGGLHFRKIIWDMHHPEELEGLVAVVEKCSNTLECIDIDRPLDDYPPTSLFDLSKATKLKEVIFRWFCRMYITWITTALKTITSEHTALQWISIHFLFIQSEQLSDVGEFEGDEVYRQWMDLDSILVHLWELRACRTKAVLDGKSGGETTYGYIEGVLPEMTKRGLIDLVYSCADE